MKTAVNAVSGPWAPEIQALFQKKLPKLEEGEIVTSANYFTPRPFVDDYNRGSDKEGFVYIINDNRVCLVEWRRA